MDEEAVRPPRDQSGSLSESQIPAGTVKIRRQCAIRTAAGDVTLMTSRAIEVLRREADGGWLLVVGDPSGRGGV
jgi:hypothetical protein